MFGGLLGENPLPARGNAKKFLVRAGVPSRKHLLAKQVL
jgi:hypothetical protein